MHRARQEAGDGHGAGARVPAQPDGTVTETVVDIDADGRLAAVRGHGSARDYAALFAPADRSRGLPAELMRLARRHGLVRDQLQRPDADGAWRPHRITLSIRRDAEGRVSGYREARTPV